MDVRKRQEIIEGGVGMVEKAIEKYMKANMAKIATLFAKYMAVTIHYDDDAGVVVFRVAIAGVEVCKDHIDIDKIIKKVVDKQN